MIFIPPLHLPVIIGEYVSPIRWVGVLFLGVCFSLPRAEAAPMITSFQIIEDTITIDFQDLDGIADAFTLQKSTNLTANSWSDFPSATFTTVNATTQRVTLPKSSADKEFFRIIGRFLGTESDPDGDGLPTAFEQTLTGANPELRDTDGDGFDDGLEFALGTGINDPNSKPRSSDLPIVEFSESMSHTFEERGSHLISIDTGSYSGPVSYTVNSERSTAVAGNDFSPLSGMTTASGGKAEISITLTDDFLIDGERILIIDLSKSASGSAYRVSGRAAHVLCISEEDAFWNGILVDRNTQRNFRLKVGKIGNVTKVDFVSGQDDGLPSTYSDREGEVADISSTSQTAGVIPIKNFDGLSKSTWPVTSPSFTNGTFSVSSPPLPVVGEKLLIPAGGNPAFQRVISLTAAYELVEDTNNATLLKDPPLIAGTFTETITHATNPAITYLDAVVTGTFALSRQSPEPPTVSTAYPESR